MWYLRTKGGKTAVSKLTGEPFSYSTLTTALIAKPIVSARDNAAYAPVKVA